MEKVHKKQSRPGNNRVFIVAELSGNHNHDIRRAKKIIDEAARLGANAIKLQTYTPDTITIDSKRPEFKVTVGKDWKGKTFYELYGEANTPWEWHEDLFEHAKKRGLICFSSPFDPTAVDFLEGLKCPIYKVASPEVVDIPLLERIGKTKKPVIMSRGMANVAEISLAIKTLKKFGCPNITLLQCVSAYPARYEDMHLATIKDMQKRFKTSVGLSDHSLSSDAAVVAVALGATVLEKHLTLNRADGGPDASFSLEPHEFASMVKAVRAAEQAVGEPFYGVNTKAGESALGRKSLIVVRDMEKGERFSEKNVRSIRPSLGLPPKYFRQVLKKRAAKKIEKGTPLSWRLVQ